MGLPFNPPAIFAEFVGTFFFVATFALACVTARPSALPFAIGTMLAIVVSVLSRVSGGHVNPAVSLGVFLAAKDRLRTLDFAGYIAAQLGGAFVGVMTANWLSNGTVDPFDFGLHFSRGYGSFQILASEALFSTLLVYVVLCVSVGESSQAIGGILIGAVVLVAAMIIGPITGTSLNPAVAFGFIIWGGHIRELPLYIMAPFIGSLAGAFLFRITYHQQYSGGGCRAYIPPFKTSEGIRAAKEANNNEPELHTDGTHIFVAGGDDEPLLEPSKSRSGGVVIV